MRRLHFLRVWRMENEINRSVVGRRIWGGRGERDFEAELDGHYPRVLVDVMEGG